VAPEEHDVRYCRRLHGEAGVGGVCVRGRRGGGGGGIMSTEKHSMGTLRFTFVSHGRIPGRKGGALGVDLCYDCDSVTPVLCPLRRGQVDCACMCEGRSTVASGSWLDLQLSFLKHPNTHCFHPVPSMSLSAGAAGGGPGGSRRPAPTGGCTSRACPSTKVEPAVDYVDDVPVRWCLRRP
jgi:hypothetical protein